MKTTKELVSLLFDKFEGDELFDKYFSLVDTDEEDLYFVFHSFSELFKDLLDEKVKKEKLFTRLCDFIDFTVSLENKEVDNVLKSEIFGVLNMEEKEKAILKSYLSDKAFEMLNLMYD